MKKNMRFPGKAPKDLIPLIPNYVPPPPHSVMSRIEMVS